MIVRVSGVLEETGEHRVVLTPPAAGDSGAGPIAYEVLVPAYLGARLAGRTGDRITLHTLEYLESQGQGTSFVPRLVGFATQAERRFFELVTTVKGLGTKKALKALAEEPATIARWIAEQDAKALQRLPEIGKRLAETIVVDLRERAQPFVVGAAVEAKAAPGRGGVGAAGLPPAAADAVEALISLGETRAEAERKVSRVLGEAAASAESTESILAAALAVR